MESGIIDQRDVDFLLFEWLRLPELLARSRFADHDTDSIRAVLNLAAQLSENALSPHMRAADLQEPRLAPSGEVEVLPAVAEGVRAIAEAGLFGAIFDAERGGLQLPYVVHMAALGLLMSGSISTASFLLLTVANARLIITFGSPSQIECFADPQIRGEALGTMCLSEPQAGSSLADIWTRAESDGEDAYGRRFRIFGAKMWISAGEHNITDNIIHLVLARTPDATGQYEEGSRGISLFIVPKQLPWGQRNDVVVAGLNHKLGYRGIPNCALNFGEGRHLPGGNPGAIGWLVGPQGQGLSQMFQMMNEARVSVGMGAAALAYRGYLRSADYARSRPQGRPPGQKHGMPVLIVQHADVQRMLLAQMAYAQGALGLVLYTARLLDIFQTGDEAERKSAEILLAILTPITKTWPSEWAQHSLNLAIQIHGGAGYTRDFDVELLYRDNRLNPIHEGTTGIQGIDLVGRKLRRDNGAGFEALRRLVAETLDRAGSRRLLLADVDGVAKAWDALATAVDFLIAEPDEAQALAFATPVLFAAGHAVIGWLWLDQALVSEKRLAGVQPEHERAFDLRKLACCRYFSLFELPKVHAWLAPMSQRALALELFRPDLFGEQ